MLCEDHDIVEAVPDAPAEHAWHAKLEKFKTPKSYLLVDESWTPESRLVTAAFKLRRKPLKEKFQAELDDMYGSLASG